MKKIFLDCGANKGQSINFALQTILKDYEYEIHSFETLPLFVTKLNKYFISNPNINIYHAAVWDKDGIERFFISPKSTESGTLIKEKTSGGISEDSFITIPTIDLSKWIVGNLNKNDYIILKFDIEGAEYKVLKHLIQTGAIEYINEFRGEFHYDKLTPTDKLVDDINFVHDYFNNNNLKFEQWEIGGSLGLVDYKKGTKPSLESSKILDYDENGNEIFYK